MKIPKLILKFFHLSFQNQLLLFEASFYTIWAYFLIRIFSFKRYASWLKHSENSNRYAPETDVEITKIALAIRRIEKYAFWPTTCYTKAISARLICKRKKIKSKLFLGVTKNDNKVLLAHAWTEVNGKIITGNTNLENYKALYIFE